MPASTALVAGDPHAAISNTISVPHRFMRLD